MTRNDHVTVECSNGSVIFVDQGETADPTLAAGNAIVIEAGAVARPSEPEEGYCGPSFG